MSETRAIKVKSCMDCPYGHTGECQNVRITNAIDPIPDSCPLPKWPLATREEIEQLFLPYGMHPQMFIEWLKFRGVEIKEVADA